MPLNTSLQTAYLFFLYKETSMHNILCTYHYYLHCTFYTILPSLFRLCYFLKRLANENVFSLLNFKRKRL